MRQFWSGPLTSNVAGWRRRHGLGRLARYRRKAAQLSASERRLLLKSGLVVAGIRAGLSFLPFRRMVRIVDRLQGHGGAARRPAPPVEQIAWSVRTSARLIPKASCLTQALAGKLLLGQYGYVTRLEIGASRGDDQTFEAHAWLDYEGRIVLGELPDHARFRPFRAR